MVMINDVIVTITKCEEKKFLNLFVSKSLNYIQSVLQTVGKQQERPHPNACD